MPREKKFLGLIPAIYKRNYEDIGMFFFVEGQRNIVPALSIEIAILNYFKYCGVLDYNLESAMTLYARMKKEYYEDSKTHK